MPRHRTRVSKKRTAKNIINKTLNETVLVAKTASNVAKTASKKYMPKVKTGLENVGAKVVNTTQQSVPYLQSMTRKFFGLFSGKTRRQRKR